MQLLPDKRCTGAVLAVVLSVGGVCLLRPAGAQVQRPPDVIAAFAGAEECDALRRQLGRDGVWVSNYTVSGGRNSFAGPAFNGSGSACFRSVQQCERFLTELSLDYQIGEASGSCRKGQ